MSVKKQILSLVIVPLIIMATVIGTVGVVIAEGYINDEIHETLRAAVLGYSGDIEMYSSEGIDMTVFTGDTRTESSIDGVVGTRASDIVIEKVLDGGDDYFDTDVSVNGQPYYGYYLPTATGMLFAGKPRADVMKNLNRYVTIIAVICCVSLILITIVAFIIGQQMAKSIQGTASNMRLLAGGSLSQVKKTAAKSDALAQKNEINAMISATNSLVERLSGIIGNVKETGFSVDKASNELSNAVEVVMNSTGQVSRAVEAIAHGAVDQNASTKDIIASLDEVNRNITTIEEAVTDIGTYITEMNNCRESVHTSIDMLSSSSGITTTNVEKIRLQIEKTHEQVDKIEQIVNVIEEIASETKMLSLNASIEAARAGEAGRGFAVVADTINSLSENVTTQVKEISNIVGELIVDFSQCEVDIDSVVESNQHQMDEIDAVIVQFSELQNSINNTVERITTIGQSIGEVADECHGVLEGAHSLNQISESNASATQQVNANIEELNAVVMQIDANAKGLANKSDDLSQQLQFFQ